METFYLTRKEMSILLLSMQGKVDKTPLAILQEAWAKNHKNEIEYGQSTMAFIGTQLPPIFEKIIKSNQQDTGFSLHEIVSLGSQIEYTSIAVTSVQNWVKRDIKDIIGSPQIGKKYSIDQAAILYMVEDLRTSLDFESIRRLLTLVFKNPNDLSDDLLSPVKLYAAYSTIFEELDRNNDQVLDIDGHPSNRKNHDHMLEHIIQQKADQFVEALTGLRADEQKAVSNTIVIAMISVQTAYFQKMAKRFLNATLFLQNL